MPQDIHAFVGSVGLAGMHGNLWSVEGGNYLVAEKLKQLSNASFIPTRVCKVLYNFYFDDNDLRKKPYVMELKIFYGMFSIL